MRGRAADGTGLAVDERSGELPRVPRKAALQQLGDGAGRGGGGDARGVVFLFGGGAALGERGSLARRSVLHGELVAADAQVALSGGAGARLSDRIVEVTGLGGNERELRVELRKRHVGIGHGGRGGVAPGEQRHLRALERPRILPPRELGGEFVDPSGDVDGCLAARRRPLRQRASCRVLGRTTLRVGALDGVDGRTQRLGGAGALEALTLDGALGRSCLELGEPRAHGRALTPLLVALDERAVLGESVAVRPLGVREHGGGLLDAVVGAADRDDQRRAARRQIARTRVHAAAIGTRVRPASNVGARVHVSLGTRVRTASTTITSTHLGAAQRTPNRRSRNLTPAGRIPRLLLDHPLGEVEERLGLRRGAGEGLLRLAAALLEVVAVLLEPAGAEEGAQQRLPLVAGRQEEPRELVLREQDHLLELLRPEPEHLAEGDADIARLRGAPDPHPVDLLLEHGARDLGGEPATALGRPVVLGRPCHAPPRVADRELEPHLGRVGERAVVAAQPLLTAVVARHRAVQREADPVEDARLAGAGAPRDEEHSVVAEGVEIDALSLAEWAEPGELERVQSHATASARTRSSSTSRRMSASCSLTPSPGRTWPRNASTSSASVRAARTRCA